MKAKIEKELGQSIEIIKDHGDFLIFNSEDEITRSNRFLKYFLCGCSPCDQNRKAQEK